MRYHFGPERLVIGKFCAIAHRAKFIMSGANHQMTGFSTYPFLIFRQGWEGATPSPEQLPSRGDTVIGNDVWIGYDAAILAGVTVGDGAIIAARALVAKDVAPYTIVAGNPAEQRKERFPRDVAAELVKIAWWDWPAEKITRNLERDHRRRRLRSEERRVVAHPAAIPGFPLPERDQARCRTGAERTTSAPVQSMLPTQP